MVEQRRKQPTDDLTSALLAGGDRRRQAHRRGDHRLPLPDGGGRQRDHDQAARPRALPPDPAPRAVRPGLRRPGAARRPRRAVDRGDAALRHVQPDGRAAPARGRRARTARSRRPAPSCCWCIGSANRDDRVFSDPDRYDIFRDKDEVAQLLSFGGGRHFCLGANLARLEAQIALREVVRRVGTRRGRPRRLPAGALDQRPRLRLGPGRDGGALMRQVRPARAPAGRRHRRLVGHRCRDRAGPGRGRLPGGARRAAHRQVRRGRRADPRRRRRGLRARRSTSPTPTRSTAFAKAVPADLGDIEVVVSNAGAGRARARSTRSTPSGSPASSTSTSSARTGWCGRSCPAWSSGSAATSSSSPPTSPCGPGRSCRRTPPASGASRAWRTRCRWSSRAPASAPRSCGPADLERDGQRLGPRGRRAFVLNQWVRFGLARHPHFLKPAAIADAITTDRHRPARRAPEPDRSHPRSPRGGPMTDRSHGIPEVSYAVARRRLRPPGRDAGRPDRPVRAGARRSAATSAASGWPTRTSCWCPARRPTSSSSGRPTRRSTRPRRTPS